MQKKQQCWRKKGVPCHCDGLITTPIRYQKCHTCKEMCHMPRNAWVFYMSSIVNRIYRDTTRHNTTIMSIHFMFTILPHLTFSTTTTTTKKSCANETSHLHCLNFEATVKTSVMVRCISRRLCGITTMIVLFIYFIVAGSPINFMNSTHMFFFFFLYFDALNDVELPRRHSRGHRSRARFCISVWMKVIFYFVCHFTAYFICLCLSVSFCVFIATVIFHCVRNMHSVTEMS